MMSLTEPQGWSLETPTTLRRPLVVVVDDDPLVLSAIERLLRKEPIELRTSRNPEEALDWVRHEEVALLIADDRMPRMSGTALLGIVKATSPGTRRLMLTGYAGETLLLAAGALGLMDLVGKPWDDDELKRLIRERLDPC